MLAPHLCRPIQAILAKFWKNFAENTKTCLNQPKMNHLVLLRLGPLALLALPSISGKSRALGGKTEILAALLLVALVVVNGRSSHEGGFKKDPSQKYGLHSNLQVPRSFSRIQGPDLAALLQMALELVQGTWTIQEVSPLA